MFAEVIYFCELLYPKIILSYILKKSIKTIYFDGLNFIKKEYFKNKFKN